GSSSHTATNDIPVTILVCAAAATIADNAGWLVVPASGAAAPSIALAPDCHAARYVASCPPGVSWVWTCTGRSNRLRSALIKVVAAGGLHRPATSFFPRPRAPPAALRLG